MALRKYSPSESISLDEAVEIARKILATYTGMYQFGLPGMEEHAKLCLELGASDFITKPFDLFQLKETLAKFLSN